MKRYYFLAAITTYTVNMRMTKKEEKKKKKQRLGSIDEICPITLFFNAYIKKYAL
jgi:hypothetical protein